MLSGLPAKLQPELFDTGVLSPPADTHCVLLIPNVWKEPVLVGGGQSVALDPTLAPSQPFFTVELHGLLFMVNCPLKALGRPSVNSTITLSDPVWLSCFS